MSAEYKMELIDERKKGHPMVRVLGYRDGALVLDKRAWGEQGARTMFLEWERKDRARRQEGK